MILGVYADTDTMGAAAAEYGAGKIRDALRARGRATIIVATGASQFAMLSRLIKAPRIDWTRVTVFHLDEYVGLPETHPASFRRYIKTRFIGQLPAPPAAVHYIDGSAPHPQAVCDALEQRIAQAPVDVCFLGIGENGHLAFNDPPADFETPRAYLTVNLDEACRRQQLGEGWFRTLDEVPRQAISMSVRQILKSRTLVNTVPDARKARAVKVTFEGELGPQHPASVIRLHPDAATFCDTAAAALLSPIVRDLCAQ